MQKLKRAGYTIEIDLTNLGYEGFTARCTYKYDFEKNKYLLTMWLKKEGMEWLLEIDSQYISGTRKTIEDNIYNIVEYAGHTTYFDPYVTEFTKMQTCHQIIKAGVN